MSIFQDTLHRARRNSGKVKIGAAVIATAGVIVASPWTPPSTPAGTANIWIDTNGGTCQDSATPVAYSDATACTPDAANDTCEGGDTVGIRSGAYGGWTITRAGANSARASVCTMTVETGGTVTMTSLNLGEQTGGDTGPDWLTIQGNETQFAGCRDKTAGSCSLRINGTYDIDNDNQVTLANFDANNQGNVAQCFHSEGSSNLTIKRGILHNCSANGGTGAMIYTSGNTQTFEDVLAYDNFLLDAGTHTECMYATSVQSLTLRRVQMWGCPTEIVFITGGSTAPNYVIENSIFQTPAGPNNNSFKFRTGGAPSPYPTNLLMRNNIFSVVTGPDSLASASGVVANNFFKSGGAWCGGSMTCANNDTSESDSSFVAPVWTANGNQAQPSTKGNFTITSSSGLRDAGSNTYCPGVDFNGNSRPVGTCDIGPYEYGG